MFIEHKPVDRFLINTHAFHNAHLIRAQAVLPSELTVPIAYSADHRGDHLSVATKLREVRDGRREKAAEKKRANAGLRKAGEAGGGLGSASGTTGKRGGDHFVASDAGC